MSSSLKAPGSGYREFLVTKTLSLQELQSELVELIHEPTGARVLHIANTDAENLFCLFFQTLPSSSNGVAHILEHTVLCGSEKFPIKDPFFSMTRRSLNTYMNALTGQDFTCYPAASQVEKDFYNLLEVYLDAVFHPSLKRVSFLQEGHRLEFTDPKNPETPLRFQGVVYNEMKGNLSTSESRLWEAIGKHLTPDLPYAHNAGGDPKEIPSLTYEELLEFHRYFYHPSRCLFFFYGDLPLSKHLDFISEKALINVPKLSPFPLLPRQARFLAPRTIEERYPAVASSQTNRDFIALSWLTAPLSEQREVLALCLLNSILMDNDASFLKRALLQSGLCATADSSLDVEMSEVPWTIVCKGCEGKNGLALRKVILETLQQCATNPFSQEKIEASLHQLEFQRTEIGGEGAPFGLTLFLRSVVPQQHGCEPEDGLLIHTLFRDLRARLEDQKYLPSLIRRYLLDNPHSLLTVLKADAALEKEERKEEEARLAALRSHLTQKDVEQIVAQSRELEAYQEASEHQTLDLLPKVELSDISLHPKDFPLTEGSSGRLSVFHHNCFTNQIVYADLLLDLPDLPAADLPLLSLFARFLTELGCGGRNFKEALAYQQAYIGGIGASLHLYPSQADPNLCRPAFVLGGKALWRNADKLFSFFADLLASPDFSDEARLKELLVQHASFLQSRLVKNAISYAAQTALSGLSTASFLHDQWNGLPYYQQVLRWARTPSSELFAQLRQLCDVILGATAPHLVLSCSQDEFDSLFNRAFFGLSDRIPLSNALPWKGNYPPLTAPSQVRFIPSPVAFTALGMKTDTYCDAAAPFLLLATELLENCHLHKEVREKGGAYGSGAQYAPGTGSFYFYSYRDPHMAKTRTAFLGALEKIGQGRFEERELEEAKLGVLQSLDAPVPPGGRAAIAYSWKRVGRSYEDREVFRKRILQAKKGEVADAVRTRLSFEKGVWVSLAGQDFFEKEKSAMPPLSIFPIEV